MPDPQAHVCLDLETLALSLDAVVISIGAVSWLEGDEPGSFRSSFSLRVDLDQPGRRIDPATVRWWMKQSDEARENSFGPPDVTLDLMHARLGLWLLDQGNPLVWTNDPSFDAAMLKDSSGVLPWPFRNTRCCRTAADFVSTTEYDALKKMLGTTQHSALDDAKLSGAGVQLFRNKTAALRQS